MINSAQLLIELDALSLIRNDETQVGGVAIRHSSRTFTLLLSMITEIGKLYSSSPDRRVLTERPMRSRLEWRFVY